MKAFKIILQIILITVVKVGAGQSIGGATSGSTAFCTAKNAGFISLSGYSGLIQFWESSINNGTSWINLGNQTSTQSYLNVSQTTLFRAIIKNGSFANDTSTSAKITIHEPSNGGVLNGGNTFCVNSGTGNLNLSGIVGNVHHWENSVDNGTTWSTIQNTISSLTYSGVTQNTIYRAIVINVPECISDTSSIASINIDKSTITGTVSGKDTLCYGSINSPLVLSGYQGNILGWERSNSNLNNWETLNSIADTFKINKSLETFAYRVIIKNGSCPTLTTVPFFVNVPKVNPANAGEDRTIELHEILILDGSGNGKPYWINDSSRAFGDNFRKEVSPEKSCSYTLMIVDSHSCITYDDVNINVVIPIPNAITPNNDGVNDYFLVENIDQYPNNTLQIFNKWGILVYSASPYINNFSGISSSGKFLPDEVYYYILDRGKDEKPLKNFILIKR